MNSMINLSVPYFCQRENKYVWYQRYNYDSILKNKEGTSLAGKIIPETKKILASITCNITSLCMILLYWALRNKPRIRC